MQPVPVPSERGISSEVNHLATAHMLNYHKRASSHVLVPSRALAHEDQLGLGGALTKDKVCPTTTQLAPFAVPDKLSQLLERIQDCWARTEIIETLGGKSWQLYAHLHVRHHKLS